MGGCTAGALADRKCVVPAPRLHRVKFTDSGSCVTKQLPIADCLALVIDHPILAPTRIRFAGAVGGCHLEKQYQGGHLRLAPLVA